MGEEQKEQTPRPGFDREAACARFDYIKANDFRVVYVENVFGGFTPNGQMFQIALCNERWPIPKQITNQLTPNGQLDAEIISERVVRDAMVREVEVELILQPAVARNLANWILKRLDEKEKDANAAGQPVNPKPS
ncbi:MAG TPA: hypothetical protein VGP72_08375 [Planctomycetota bacterium]|jgi:hypothetical protein